MDARTLVALPALLAALAGCAQIQRAETAEAAKHAMVGMPAETVFTCMGPPARKARHGQTEIWTYESDGNSAAAARKTTRAGASEEVRRCTVNVVLREGHATAVNYSGPTGGLLTGDEQCAYVVSNCAPRR